MRPSGRSMRTRLAVMCAFLLVVMGTGSVTADAEGTDGTDSMDDTSETVGETSGIRGISVSGADSVSLAQNSAETEEESNEIAGLYLDKYLTEDEEGTLLVSLESYVTGDSTKVASGEPADILLLLDASTSMTYSISDGTSGGSGATRLEALQEGAASFIETIQEQNTGLAGEDQSRIAILGFNWNMLDDFLSDDGDRFMAVDDAENSDNADTLIEYIYNWGSYLGGGTSTGDALERAETLMKELSESYAEGEERRQIIILFTDGWPTSDLGGIQGYSVTEAAQALEEAYTLKQAGVEIFCVSVSTGVEATEGEDLPTYVKEGYDGTYLASNPVHYLSEEMNTLLGSDGYTTEELQKLYINTLESNVQSLEARFLYLLSSDNPDVYDIDDDGVTTGGYFYTAHDTDALTGVFTTLASLVGAASVSIGSEAQIRDYVTDEFVIADTEAVRIYTAAYNGDGTWSDPVEIADPAASGYSITVSENEITVSGFDYAANYVSDTPHTDTGSTYYGCKLIITFPISAASGTFGGNVIATNTTDSGLYISTGSGEPDAEFPVPYADVEIIYEMDAVDAEYYVPDAAELSGLLTYLEGYQPNGSNNACVNIVYTMVDTSDESGTVLGTLTIPAGTSADECSWVWNSDYTDGTAPTCGTYTISCQVTPVNTGTYTGVTDAEDAKVHIYYPELTLQDTTQCYGDTADILPGDSLDSGGLGAHFISVYWICSDEIVRSAEEGPVLGYRIAVSEGLTQEGETYVIASQDDIPVVVGVYRISDDALADDITVYTIFHHECSRTDCGYEKQSAEFTDLGIRCLIHVSDDAEDSPSASENDTTDTESESGEESTSSAAQTSSSGSGGTVSFNTVAAEEDIGEDTIEIAASATPNETEDAAQTTLTREIPQTGDASDILLWLLTAGGSAAGLAVCMGQMRRERKRR